LAAFVYPDQRYEITKTNENLQEEFLDYTVEFSGLEENYCIGVVDMVNSTKIASILHPSKMAAYYGIFLNSMSRLIGQFGGLVIKNIGDCLVYYFPKSSKLHPKSNCMACLECCFAMMENHDGICNLLKEKKLPNVHYRISLDYGKVLLMKSGYFPVLDMIGPPINMCSKINRSAEPNGMVIGGDLFLIVKDFEAYQFKEMPGFSLGFKHSYPIFRVRRSENSKCV